MTLETVVALFILLGAFFTLVGTVGMVRFRALHARLHGPTKATTLGVGSLLTASVIHAAAQGEGIHLNRILIVLFLYLAAPISGSLMAKAGMILGLAQDDPPPPLE